MDPNNQDQAMSNPFEPANPTPGAITTASYKADLGITNNDTHTPSDPSPLSTSPSNMTDNQRAKREKFDEMLALMLHFRDTVNKIRPRWEEENKERVAMLFAEMVQEIDERERAAVDDLTNMFQGLMSGVGSCEKAEGDS